MRRTLLVPILLALSGCGSHLKNLHSEEPAGNRAIHAPAPTRPDSARTWPTAMDDEVGPRRDDGSAPASGERAAPASTSTPAASDVAPNAGSPTTSSNAGAAGPRLDPGDAAETADGLGDPEGDELPPTDASALGSLGDPRLRALVQEALESNRDARAAMARVFQSWALADQARARLMPQVTAQVVPAEQQMISPGFGPVFSRGITASVPVSYEVDLAGRLWLETRATREEAEASALDLAALDIAIAAEVTEAWLDLVYLNVQRTQLERQLETNQRVLDLVDARFRSGIAGETDMLQQRQQVAATRTRLAQLVGQDRIAAARLAVVLGRSPEGMSADVAVDFPPLATLPSDGIAVASVEQRPDVRASMRRLRAADRRYLIAARQNLPSLVLNGSVGYQDLYFRRVSQSGPGTTGHGPVWSVSATLSAPLFQGLRNIALRGQARSRVDELVATYERTMISALAEVESALAREAQQRALLETIEAQRANAAELRASAEAQYRAGITDFLTVFVAVQAEQTAELSLVATQRSLYSARVQLIRALGGNVTGPAPSLR